MTRSLQILKWLVRPSMASSRILLGDDGASDFAHLFPKPQPTPHELTSHFDALQSSLVSSYPGWLQEKYLAANPYPFYISPEKIAELRTLHRALHKALTHIVNTWWENPKHEIPLSAKMERVLKEISGRKTYNSVRSFRPDFLIPDRKEDKLKICEINARFPLDGFYTGEFMQQALRNLGTGLEKSTVDDILAAFTGIHDVTAPIALVRGCEEGTSIQDFHNLHPSSRFVHPSALRLIISPESPTGYALTDDIGVLEHFILELRHDEFELLDEQVLINLGLRCYNDLRTIFFVHDKRMLALLRSNAAKFVQADILSPDEGESILEGIAETIIPKSIEFERLIHDGGSKDAWLLKPCQLGKGEGIIFGKDLEQDKWLSLLERQRSIWDDPSFFPNDALGVLQKRVLQRPFDMLIRGERVQWHIVGTMLCLGDKFLGTTGWKASPSDVVSILKGGVYMGGVTLAGGFLNSITSNDCCETNSGSPSQLV